MAGLLVLLLTVGLLFGVAFVTKFVLPGMLTGAESYWGVVVRLLGVSFLWVIPIGGGLGFLAEKKDWEVDNLLAAAGAGIFVAIGTWLGVLSAASGRMSPFVRLDDKENFFWFVPILIVYLVSMGLGYALSNRLGKQS